jgi:hypothetical protein
VSGGVRWVLFVCAVLFAADAYMSEAQAARDEFYYSPYFAPWPGQYYRPAWRQRYYAPPRKRKVSRSAQRRATYSRKRQRAALAVPRRPMRAEPRMKAFQQTVSCEKAQAIVGEYGFKEIKADLCVGATFHFSATRDGKPFSIQIEAANGELAKVQRHR